MAVLLSPLLARGQAPARDNPTAVKGTASIRGRVVDATGKPLSRVEIRASNGTGAPANGLTDGDGRYDLNELPAGTYLVQATKANYVRSSYGEQRPEGPGRRLTLADGQRLDNISLRLARGGVITGRIVDEFGDPVTDVFVQAVRYQYVQGQRRLTPNGRSGPTNDLGEFRLYGLSPGQYYVSATLRSVQLNAAALDSNDRSGYAPTFYPGTGNVAEAQRMTIAPGQTVNGINLTLLPIQLARVSGTATGVDGKPVPNAMAFLTSRGGGIGMNTFAGPLRPDGTFAFGGVAPGDYTIRLNIPTGESADASVTVGGSDVTGIELIAAKPSTIRGRVVFTDSETGAPPPKPTAIDLGAWRDWSVGQQVRFPATIKDDGTFEISSPSVHVLLRAAMMAGGAPPAAGGPAPWRLSRVIVHDIDVSDSGVDVPLNGSVDNVIVEMTNRSNEISIHATDADGKVVRDCWVIVFAQDPARWTVQTRYLSASRPALDDLFHGRLLAGDYYAVAMTDVEQGAWTDSDFLSLAREQATKFSIADGEKKTLDLQVVPAPVF